MSVATASKQGLWTPAMTAAYLGVSMDRLYRIAQAGLIPRVLIGRTVRFDPDAIRTFVENGGGLAQNNNRKPRGRIARRSTAGAA